MCAPNLPPQPDYIGAANAQGAANVEAARAGSKLSNPNVINPYGTQTVTYGGFDQAGYDKALADYNAYRPTYDPVTGRQTSQDPTQPTREQFNISQDTPTVTQTFSPEQQALYEQNVRTKQLLGGLGEQGSTALQGVVGKQLDLSGVPQAPGGSEATRTKVIDAMMGRVNEDYGRATDDTHSRLIAAGIRPGSKAYDDQMQLLQRGRNDAAQQAYLAGGQEMTRDFQTDTQRRKDAIAELLSQRQVPLNEITALLSGSQVSNPFAVPGYTGTAAPAPAPIFGATQQAGNYQSDLYNAQAAQQGNLMQGLFGLGSSAILRMSDRRLKSNITRIGTHPLGIGWYAYDIAGRQEEGVMADEVLQVKPEAVSRHATGYLQVDYGRL